MGGGRAGARRDRSRPWSRPSAAWSPCYQITARVAGLAARYPNRTGPRPGSGPRDHPLMARNSAENCWLCMNRIPKSGRRLEAERRPGIVEAGWAPQLDVAARRDVLGVPALHPQDVLRYAGFDGSR